VSDSRKTDKNYYHGNMKKLTGCCFTWHFEVCSRSKRSRRQQTFCKLALTQQIISKNWSRSFLHTYILSHCKHTCYYLRHLKHGILHQYRLQLHVKQQHLLTQRVMSNILCVSYYHYLCCQKKVTN